MRAVADRFQESKQDVIDLSDEDDPDALRAMIDFCYHGTYIMYRHKHGENPTHQHLTMYRLADFYDIPDLCMKTSHEFVASLSPVGSPNLSMTDEIVRSIQQILGPEAESFANNTIQNDV
jgi:hypothetical protein